MNLSVFNVHYDGEIINPNPPLYNGYKQLNVMQEEVYSCLSNSQYGLINAPTGSGKTLAIENLCYCYLKNNIFKNIVITAPQTVIRDQYIYNKFISSKNDSIDWNVYKRNTYGTNLNPIKNLKINLQKNKPSFLFGVHLTTHQAFTKLFLDDNGCPINLDLLKDTLIIVDEVHHVMADNYKNEKISNRLGLIKRSIFEEKNIGFLGMSATPYRSDGLKIIPDEYKDIVDTYYYSYDRYISSLNYLKYFGYDISLYEEKNPLNRIKAIHKENGIKKEIIFIPNINSHHSWDSKDNEVLDVFNCIGKIIKEDNIFVYVKIDNQIKKYINLVDDSNRDKKKEYLKGDCEDLDGIIALGMAKEGFDWKYLERVVLIGGRSSMVELSQIFGRLTRDCQGKEKVNLYHIIPKPITGNVENNVNDLLFSFYVGREYGDQMISLESITPNPGKGKYIKGLGIPRVRILDEILSEEDFIKVRIECEVRLENFIQSNPLSSKSKQKKEFREILKNILERDYSVDQDCLNKLASKLGITITWRMLANQCWHMWSYSAFKLIHPTLTYNENVCTPSSTIKYYFKSIVCDKESWENFSSNLRKSLTINYVNYKELKNIININNIITIKQYRNFMKNSNDLFIPYDPNIYYKNKGWEGWYSFFNKENPYYIRKPCSIEESKKIIAKNNIKTGEEYKIWWRKNGRKYNMPSTPEKSYKNKGWKGWDDFLGNLFPSFIDAKNIVKENNIKTQLEYKKWVIDNRGTIKMPSNPNVTYKDKGWVNWKDFLENNFISFEQAKKIIYSYGFKSEREYYEWWEKNKHIYNIPAIADCVYKNDGWVSWKDFLGSEYPDIEYVKKIIKDKKIKSKRDYYKWHKDNGENYNLPPDPYSYYKGKNKRWKGWDDFLGTTYIKYCDLKNIVLENNIKSGKEYYDWYKENREKYNIPSCPNITYKNKGWINWKDFLNNYNEFPSIEKAKIIIKPYKFTSRKNYHIWCKNNKEQLPLQPQITYKNKGWISWGDFLGKE